MHVFLLDNKYILIKYEGGIMEISTEVEPLKRGWLLIESQTFVIEYIRGVTV